MGPGDSVGPLYVGSLRTELRQPAWRRRGSLETWQVADGENYLLGVWATGSQSPSGTG